MADQSHLSADQRADQSTQRQDATVNEILIQYGQLHSDLAELSIASQRQPEKSQELGTLTLVTMMMPFVTLEVFYKIVVGIFPGTVAAAMRSFLHQPFMYLFSFDPFPYLPDQIRYLEIFHAMLFLAGAPLIFFFALLILLGKFNAMGANGLSKPSHLGISEAGIRTHKRTMSISRAGRLRRWSQLSQISVVEKKKRKTKSIILKFADRNRSTLSIDVNNIRRQPEKDVLANALKLLTPNSVATDDLIKLVDVTLPRAPRYTEIWTQALLNKPQRQLLTALEPETQLHEGLYTVKKLLGAGAQGTAYLVERTDNGETNIVLKEYVLPDHNNMHDRRRALKRLEDEVQILSKLNHPQIVHLHDVFIEDHRAYLVMDFIDGQSLKQLVQGGRVFSVEEVIDLAKQMCTILEYLHSLSPCLVHQDFTPDNLILTKSNLLKLVDFNVARESAGTKTNLVVGKQSYMPPEQFRGKTSEQSDIYAFGATLAYLLTGKDPEPLAVSHPRAFRDDVFENFDKLVAKMTGLEAEDRYRTVADVTEALQKMNVLCEDLTVRCPSAQVEKVETK